VNLPPDPLCFPDAYVADAGDAPALRGKNVSVSGSIAQRTLLGVFKVSGSRGQRRLGFEASTNFGLSRPAHHRHPQPAAKTPTEPIKVGITGQSG
jgi:hypothetical protein